MIKSLAEYLASTSLSHILLGVKWIIPVIQTVHILAIAVVMSSMAMLDLRLLQVDHHPHSIAQSARRFLPWVWTALGVLLASGTVLNIAEPERELGSPAFWAKMILILLVIPITLLLHFALCGNVEFWSNSPSRRTSARLLAILSFLLLLAIITAGRWIAYYQAPV